MQMVWLDIYYFKVSCCHSSDKYKYIYIYLFFMNVSLLNAITVQRELVPIVFAIIHNFQKKW